MTHRERVNAILHYEKYDAMPVVAFGYWNETLDKWHKEGHVTLEECQGYAREGDNGPADKSVMKKLGFDFSWSTDFSAKTDLFPHFERTVLKEHPDGKQEVIDENGLIVLVDKNIVSIPSEIGNTLKDRKSWEELYLPKLQFSAERIPAVHEHEEDLPYGVWCGSLYGKMRDLLGVQGISYLYADDEDLYVEIIDTFGNLAYQVLEKVMDLGIKFDFGHFWEDICFKNGPLVIPSVFEEYVGPHYAKITNLLKKNGVDIVSLDCDGMIDSLIPTWLENGVNTMFPIEVGTWEASIAPWREKYGKALRGVGGMNKVVFAHDRQAIDREIERLKPLVDLGGYIPCPDHRIPPDAKFELVQYYCEKMRETFAR